MPGVLVVLHLYHAREPNNRLMNKAVRECEKFCVYICVCKFWCCCTATAAACQCCVAGAMYVWRTVQEHLALWSLVCVYVCEWVSGKGSTAGCRMVV